MNVESCMRREVRTCPPNVTLNEAAHLLWEHDCGALPVVEHDGRVVGMVTDRDICMAAYTKGRPLREIRLADVMATSVQSCRASSTAAQALELMRRHQVRRLPVLDGQGQLAGIVTLSDLTRALYGSRVKAKELSPEHIAQTLAAICEPRCPLPASETVIEVRSPQAAKPRNVPTRTVKPSSRQRPAR